MTATLDELTTPLSVDDVTNAIYAAIAARGVNTTTWKPGAATRTIIAACAIVIAALSLLQAQLTKLGFLTLSTGAWLAAVALYVYGVVKDEGGFATGVVRLTNASGFVYSLGTGDLTVTNSTTGKSYKNTAPFTLGATTFVDVPIEAVELGTASNANPTEIDTMTTTLLGVTCSNAGSLVGSDVEGDAALQARCTEKTGSLSPNGPSDAYRFFASSTPRADGSSIGVNRVRTVADGFGNVTVYVATPSGTVSSPDVAVLDDAIQRNAVPEAVTATVVSASAHSIPVTYEVWVDTATGLSTGDITAAISAALVAYLSLAPIAGWILPGVTPPGQGRVYLSGIEAVIGNAVPGILRVDITLPSGDVDIAASEAPVHGTITPTAVHLVSGSG